MLRIIAGNIIIQRQWRSFSWFSCGGAGECGFNHPMKYGGKKTRPVGNKLGQQGSCAKNVWRVKRRRRRSSTWGIRRRWNGVVERISTGLSCLRFHSLPHWWYPGFILGHPSINYCSVIRRVNYKMICFDVGEFVLRFAFTCLWMLTVTIQVEGCNCHWLGWQSVVVVLVRTLSLGIVLLGCPIFGFTIQSSV